MKKKDSWEAALLEKRTKLFDGKCSCYGNALSFVNIIAHPITKERGVKIHLKSRKVSIDLFGPHNG